MELDGGRHTIHWGEFSFDINKRGELVRSEETEANWYESVIAPLADLAIQITRREIIEGQGYREPLLLEEEYDHGVGEDSYIDYIEDTGWVDETRRAHHEAQLAELDDFARNYRTQAEALPFEL